MVYEPDSAKVFVPKIADIWPPALAMVPGDSCPSAQSIVDSRPSVSGLLKVATTPEKV